MKANEENTVVEKNLRYYLALSYPMELHKDEDSYTALYPDLPGCMSYGDTPNDAVSALERMKRLWISGRLEAGMSVPEPTDLEGFSGKFLVRIPKSLHRTLHFQAQQEGISLNQFVIHKLSCNSSHDDAARLSAAIQTALAGIGQRLMEKSLYSSHAPKTWTIRSADPNFAVLELLRHGRDSFHYPQAPLVFSKKTYVEAICE